MESNESAFIEDDRFELRTELEKGILENFRDPICLGIVNILNNTKKPAECLSCRQIFCYDCAHDLINRKKDCPLCRKSFTIGPMNHKLLSILLDIECKCQYFNRGCEYKSPLKLLTSHEKECTHKTSKEVSQTTGMRGSKVLTREETQKIDTLAMKIEDLHLDDETFNQVMAAGAFDENGNIDFAKIQQIILSKGSNSTQKKVPLEEEKQMPGSNQSTLKPESVKGENRNDVPVREKNFAQRVGEQLGESIGSLFNSSQARSSNTIAGFFSGLLASKSHKSQSKDQNNGSNSKPNPFQVVSSSQIKGNPQFGQSQQLQPNQSQQQPVYFVPNFVMLDARYRCQGAHPLGLVQNLALLPFTNNPDYQQNAFYCRVCLTRQLVGPAGVVHCMTCQFDVCPTCAAFPITCSSNHMLQKVYDLVNLPPKYKTNEAFCNVCQIKVKPDRIGVLICLTCNYHMCVDCAKSPVLCARGHPLRRENGETFFPKNKYRCLDCGEQKERIDKGIGVLMCRTCLYYRCEDCFIKNRPQMKFTCAKKHEMQRLFKFGNPSLFSLQVLGMYKCQSCKVSKAIDAKGVWNCSKCSFNICTDCLVKQ